MSTPTRLGCSSCEDGWVNLRNLTLPVHPCPQCNPTGSSAGRISSVEAELREEVAELRADVARAVRDLSDSEERRAAERASCDEAWAQANRLSVREREARAVLAQVAPVVALAERKGFDVYEEDTCVACGANPELERSVWGSLNRVRVVRKTAPIPHDKNCPVAALGREAAAWLAGGRP